MAEKEIDISIFLKLLDPNNEFVETVRGEPEAQQADELKAAIQDLRSRHRLSMAQRDKLRPKGFQV